MQLHTYLNYGGNCEEAFAFYEKHLGGKILMKMTFGEMPPGSGGPPLPADWKSKILYSRLQIGETYVMGNDVTPDRFQPMRSVYLSMSVESSAEAERIFALLVNGGETFMPMSETFFAHRFGMLRDKFGTSWMIIHERPMPS
jgi:PhnB protein